MTADRCNDNRYELIEKYKQKLIKATNIETSTNEMAVIDDILFRFYQMGWLDLLEKQIAKTPQHIDKNGVFDGDGVKVCPVCGGEVD